MIWRDAVINALHRFSVRNSTKIIERQALIHDEIDQIVNDVKSVGATPEQTLSRVLQELRDEGLIYFKDGSGTYLLTDTTIQAESIDLPIEAIDFLIKHNKLGIAVIPASDKKRIVRQRIGQSRIRNITLENYRNECAFCDVKDSDILIASHISRWADDPEGRGDLRNTICTCSFHDALFEKGYFSLDDDFSILKRKIVTSEMITIILDRTSIFKKPISFVPSSAYLIKHRKRTGY